ncbi:hypothetical protein VNO77_16383 [Canavalia gladiata]|uniref:Uncharacterized protein n=1 Tax=Canavalia gladiata TaxID=3824 RepID=A0AAN9M5R5_CANGL
MGRTPCCEKMGLKKGPWTPHEDLILINYINTYGHKNWRALPKQAGLLRCGKSCRLRWTNYLRPDIKRGNFTREEENMIIQLHEMLGNRWSAIAARLPGRTDNEIKNVWHTHLKKKKRPKQEQEEPVNFPTHHHVIEAESVEERPLSSPQCLSSDVSTLTTTHNTNHHSNGFINRHMSIDNVESLDDHFWSQVLSDDNSDDAHCFPATRAADLNFQFPFSPLPPQDSLDFWYI